MFTKEIGIDWDKNLLMEGVNNVYNKETGLNLSYYTLTPADGTRRII